MKGYSAFLKALALLKPHKQIVLCHIQDTRWWWWGVLSLFREASLCILQPQPTGLNSKRVKTNLIWINKERTCYYVDVAFSADHKMKVKENEKIDKYFNSDKELKSQWNTKVTVIPIVVDAHGTVL